MIESSDLTPRNECCGVFLSICCDFDGFPQIVAEFREKYLYPKLHSLGMEVKLCHGAHATEQNVKDHLGNHPILYVTGAGHGLDDEFQGDLWTSIFKVGQYDRGHIAGKIVHLTSCSTGAELGPDFVKNGCRAFFGYKERFIIPGEVGFNEALECDAEIDLGFAEGLTAEQVYHKVMEAYTAQSDKLARKGEVTAEQYLLENRDSLCAPSVGSNWGDVHATLFSN